jgi:16S rRNA G966 N2-methylase RsmD
MQNSTIYSTNDLNFTESSKILKKFRMNETARYSITRPFEAYQIYKNIEKEIQESNSLENNDTKYLTITDGTAGVGGDTINFSKYFKVVHSVELCRETYNLLNLNVYDFQARNVRTYNDSYCKIYDKLKQHIIYIDPPWGGTSYKEKDKIILKLDDLKIDELVEKIFKN